MKKLKIGDVVRLKSLKIVVEERKSRIYINPLMNKFFGGDVIVAHVSSNGDFDAKKTKSSSSWCYSRHWIQKPVVKTVIELPEMIFEDEKGASVIALTRKEAKAAFTVLKKFLKK